MLTNTLSDSPVSQPNSVGCEVLVETSLHVITQLEDALEQLSQQQYAGHAYSKSSPIGGHVRHIVEFYQALFTALSTSRDKILCYDKRERNILLETSKDAVLQELSGIKTQLLSLDIADKSADDGGLALASIIDPDQPMFTMKTTLHRELFYLLDHMVHHMALIKMIAEGLGVKLDKNFGLAQSTKAYKNTQK